MKIGNRIIKSAIAVFLSLVVFLILHALNFALGYTESPSDYATNPAYASLWYVPTNFYTPFFAGIAAVYALSRNVAESRQQAKLRSLGSVVGGYYGYVVIALTELVFLNLFNLEEGSVLYRAILYTIVAGGIIGLIGITVKYKITYVSFISCLTYLSVTVSIRNGGMDPFLFATNRVLSTVIGVLIALFVNTFPQRLTKNRNILFVTSLDNLMLNEQHKLNPFMEYKLNSLLGERCSYTFMTTRAMTSLSNIFKNVSLKNPIVVMTGCATYDPVAKSYEGVVTVSPELRKPLEEIFAKHDASFLSYVVNDNIMHAYYNKIDNIGTKEYYDSRKKHASYSFVQGSVPEFLPVAQYVLIDTNERINSLVSDIYALPEKSEYNVISYPFDRVEGYSFLKINYKEAQKYTALKRIMEEKNYNYVVCFGSGHTDVEAMKKADFSVCLNDAPDYIKDAADFVLSSNDPERVIRLMAKIFHRKNYQKLIDDLKTGKYTF